MRLVTWNLGHRRNGNRRPERFVAALGALEPDIAVLVDRTPGAASSELLAALADIGLRHQLRSEPDARGAQVLLASRLEMVPGTMDPGASATPADALHAYSPTGLLDVVSLPSCRHGGRSASDATCWNWLLEATAALKPRRSIVFGDLQDDPSDADSGSSHPVRHFIRQGWQHAMPTEGASYATTGGHALTVDHAFLSPSLQRIDAHYAMGAAGFRLAGSKDSLSERPALVVDLQ
jgi:hypothetical protein